jgi:hypothetical protein
MVLFVCLFILFQSNPPFCTYAHRSRVLLLLFGVVDYTIKEIQPCFRLSVNTTKQQGNPNFTRVEIKFKKMEKQQKGNTVVHVY